MGQLQSVQLGDYVRVMQTPDMEVAGHANKKGRVAANLRVTFIPIHEDGFRSIRVDGTGELIRVPLSAIMKLKEGKNA